LVGIIDYNCQKEGKNILDRYTYNMNTGTHINEVIAERPLERYKSVAW
jgi:hypothetical protein